MRNEGKEPTADGPVPDDGSTYTSAAARRPHRQKQQMIAGAAGVLAVLGVGGVIAVSRGDDKPVTMPTAEAGPPASLPDASAGATPARTSAGATPALPASGAASGNSAEPAPPQTTTSPDVTKREPDTGRGPLPKPTKTYRPLSKRSVVKDSDVKIDETVSGDGRQRMKVVSAAADLTGYRELGWVTEVRKRVGEAECTQTIRLSPDAPPRERPTLLICWRVSAARSVYTVAVDMKGRPSEKGSVELLEKAWRKLG
ncbi:hypothetical protein J2S43_006651 [Catenuloplanes nepalensis]|uniref:Serine/threonine protein kinase n=1 Tax=Catenuloplanes nepalensis TaxID=587533 RepID=A0ABT9N364_9ACTN|nr:hypothetical protein [Catenuloplanes nepalensis]MDP9798139.1 hypothetical protein [Catenuloplanes nepalensis]